MTAADNAFQIAERLIEQARQDGGTYLNLNTQKTRALTTLPDSIKTLTNLQDLRLNNTQVGDAGLKHITALTHLQRLILDNTRIRDLRPLTRLTKLADQEGDSWQGLHFKNTPACDLDPRIKTLSEIENGPKRTAALFDYLNSLKDWPPLPEAAKNPIEQTGRGFQYVVDHNGKTAYDRTPSIIGENQKLSQLHQLLCADAATYLRSAPDDDPFYRIITEKVALYQAQLGDGLNAIVPVLLWKAGNDLRLQLAGQKQREATAGPMANTPALDDQLRILLESIVTLHNAFANLHPEIAPLETAAQDSAERAAQLDKAAIGEIIAALAPQVTLLMENVRNDLADLHKQALGDTQAAMRALIIEDESLKNLIAHVVAQAVIEARDDSFLSKIGGDVRSALVGAGVATLGPEVAAAYPHLVTQLQPFIAQLASAWQGPFTNIDQVVEWVKIRLSLAGDDSEE